MRNFWLYNYSFEFELCNRKSAVNHNINPCYLLDRCQNFFLPLVDEDDFILCYEKPNQEHLRHIKKTFGFLPNYLEANKPLLDKDLKYDDLTPHILKIAGNQIIQISPWGHSKQVSDLMKKTGDRRVRNKSAIVKLLNSKLTSSYLRNCLNEKKYQIPSIAVDLKTSNLANEIRHALDQFETVFLKDYFGVSGKLKIQISNSHEIENFISKKAKYFKESEGILIEEKIKVKTEFSLQYLFEKSNYQFLSFNGLINSKHGAYIGNSYNCNYGIDIGKVKKDLIPVTDFIKDLGYEGYLGIDFAQTESNEIKMLEINARFTMGGIATAWLNKIGQNRPGVFINTFFNSPKPLTIIELLEFLEIYSKKVDFRYSLIHYHINPSPSQKHLITLALSAESIASLRMITSKCLSRITGDEYFANIVEEHFNKTK